MHISVDTMTELSDALLAALRNGSEWMTRRDIADAIGRPRGRLNPYDIQLLSELSEQGLIEISQRPAPVRKEWIYRAKS